MAWWMMEGPCVWVCVWGGHASTSFMAHTCHRHLCCPDLPTTVQVEAEDTSFKARTSRWMSKLTRRKEDEAAGAAATAAATAATASGPGSMERISLQGEAARTGGVQASNFKFFSDDEDEGA